MGVVTGRGPGGLVRDRWGVRAAAMVPAALVLANLGTLCAEFAGIAPGAEVLGVSRTPACRSPPSRSRRWSSRRLPPRRARPAGPQPGVRRLHRRGRPGGSRLAAPPGAASWCPRCRVVRGRPIAVATIGTTLAPWGLSFMQSYAVDKRLATGQLRYERIDVVTGAVLTGVIGVFVVVACAATLHAAGISIESARRRRPGARAARRLRGLPAVRPRARGGRAARGGRRAALDGVLRVASFGGRPAGLDRRPRASARLLRHLRRGRGRRRGHVLIPGRRRSSRCSRDARC